MSSTSKILTFVVPAYNMEAYVERCVSSLLSAKRVEDLEIIIVDDGSTDGTAEVADTYAQRLPNVIRVIHQPNKGHGGAVNAGVAAANGLYIKIVDADDRVDPLSLERVLRVLREQSIAVRPVDMVVTDYVYDKVGRRFKHVVRFNSVIPAGEVISWDDLGSFNIAQYMIMHSLIFRTQVVRDCGLKLPEHTFYVDFIYSYQPFPYVKTLIYLNTPFYQYYTGREGQSVQTDVMVKRVDQLVEVNHQMVKVTPQRGTVPDGLYRYMIHYLAIETSVTSVFLILSRDPENYKRKQQLWDDIDNYMPEVGRDVRREPMARLLNVPIPGEAGRFLVRNIYHLIVKIFGLS